MSEFQAVFRAASQLSVQDRLRLIDELASTVPENEPPLLSREWLQEIERRSAEIEAGTEVGQPWEEVRKKVFGKPGINCAD